MNKLYKLVFLIACLKSPFVSGQTVFHRYFDTDLLPGYRISGKLDSVDFKLSIAQSNLPGTFTPLTPDFRYTDLYRVRTTPIVKRFSAIPHVGFGYSMGSRLYQVGKITYTQTIDTNTYIQFDYNRISTNGMMRNNSVESNQVDWSLMHNGQHYGTEFVFHYFNGKYGINGGLLGDTLDQLIDLQFQPVKKENAERIYKSFTLDWNNYFSVLPADSTSEERAGFFVDVNYGIANSRYQEVDTLPGIYGVIHYDSITTNDYWEKTNIALPVGVFYSNAVWSGKAGLKVNYWDYDNLIVHRDTVEVSTFADFEGSFRGWKGAVGGRYTFIGAQGENRFYLNLSRQWQKIAFGLRGEINAAYPQIYQRYFYGNNAAYTWTNKQLTNVVSGEASLAYRNRIIPISVSAFYYSAQNAPEFDGQSWHSDADYSYTGLRLNASYMYKVLLLQFNGTVQASSHNFLPATLLNGRIAYNGALFKAKKLKTVTGFEIGQIGTFNALQYIPYMNVYGYDSSFKRFVNMPKLHFYTQFDLGYFRWFIRLENIEQAIIHSTNQPSRGYSVAPMQVRFGVSWDFFN